MAAGVAEAAVAAAVVVEEEVVEVEASGPHPADQQLTRCRRARWCRSLHQHQEYSEGVVISLVTVGNRPPSRLFSVDCVGPYLDNAPSYTHRTCPHQFTLLSCAELHPMRTRLTLATAS